MLNAARFCKNIKYLLFLYAINFNNAKNKSFTEE